MPMLRVLLPFNPLLHRPMTSRPPRRWQSRSSRSSGLNRKLRNRLSDTAPWGNPVPANGDAGGRWQARVLLARSPMRVTGGSNEGHDLRPSRSAPGFCDAGAQLGRAREGEHRAENPNGAKNLRGAAIESGADVNHSRPRPNRVL